jgi:hypothetical protein
MLPTADLAPKIINLLNYNIGTPFIVEDVQEALKPSDYCLKTIRTILRALRIKFERAFRVENLKGTRLRYTLLYPLEEDDINEYHFFLKSLSNQEHKNSYFNGKKEITRFINEHLGEILTVESIFLGIAPLKVCKTTVRNVLRTLINLETPGLEVTRRRRGVGVRGSTPYKYIFNIEIPLTAADGWVFLWKENDPEVLKYYKALNFPKPKVLEIEAEEIQDTEEVTVVATAMNVNMVLNEGISWGDLTEERKQELINKVRPFLNRGMEPDDVVDYAVFVKNTQQEQTQ